MKRADLKNFSGMSRITKISRHLSKWRSWLFGNRVRLSLHVTFLALEGNLHERSWSTFLLILENILSFRSCFSYDWRLNVPRTLKMTVALWKLNKTHACLFVCPQFGVHMKMRNQLWRPTDVHPPRTILLWQRIQQIVQEGGVYCLLTRRKKNYLWDCNCKVCEGLNIPNSTYLAQNDLDWTELKWIWLETK